MRLSAFFPTRDIGRDPAKIRDWAQAAEDLGYSYIEVPDHVFGATARDGWTPLYNETDPFHETMTTLAFLAAATKTIKLSSGILILPQRQTGVVAKQAAEIDILSGGRLAPRRRRRLEPRRVPGARRRLEDARGAAGRTGSGAAPLVDGRSRHLRRQVSRSARGQHRSPADPAADPDLVRRLV